MPVHEARVGRTKTEKNKSIIRVGYFFFNAPLSVIDRKTRQKPTVSKDRDLKNSTEQFDLSDICGTVCKQSQNTYDTLINTDHVLDHKLSLNKFKRSKSNIHPMSLSTMELEINNKISRKKKNLEVKQHTSKQVKEEIKEIMKYFEVNKIQCIRCQGPRFSE